MLGVKKKKIRKTIELSFEGPREFSPLFRHQKLLPLRALRSVSIARGTLPDMTEASVGIAAVPEAVAARKASSSNASTSASSTAAATSATNQQQQASALVHTAIGAVAGVVEVSIMQPTVAIKNALQVRLKGESREKRAERRKSKKEGTGAVSFFFLLLADRVLFFLERQQQQQQQQQAGRPIPWSPPELYRGYAVR